MTNLPNAAERCRTRQNWTCTGGMNHKTVFLHTLQPFDEITGEYTLKCVCGAHIVIAPSQLLHERVNIPCSECYLQYDLQLSGEDFHDGGLTDRAGDWNRLLLSP